MGYFKNCITVTFEDLSKAIDNDGKRIYSEELIQKIENAEFNYLNTLDLVDRNNKYFMEPLLYAVKNSKYSTYEVYKYYGEDLQKGDLTTATEIVINEPKVFKDTMISDEASIVLYLVDYNPEIIMYISDDLKNDGEFIEELCEDGNQEAIMYIAKECDISTVLEENPNLANNPDFMKEAIKNDTETLNLASGELKNDYNFMKEIAENEKTIEYVLEHTDEFGVKGLSGTKDAVIEKSTDEAKLGFEEEQKKIRKQIEEVAEEKASDSTDLEELLKKDKQLQRHIHFFERIKNGEVDPVRAAKLIDKICVNLDDKYRDEIKKVLKLDEVILEKQKESKEKEEIQTEGITHESVEKATEGASLEGIENETGAIRKNIEMERIQEATEEKQVGE